MLSFDEPTHTYRWNGRIVPSVTQILAPLEDFERVPWDVLEAARQFGSHVHQAVHLHILGQLDWQALDPALAPYVRAADKFLASVKADISDAEVRLYSEASRYAGTCDLVAIWKVRTRTRRTLLDWKATAAFPPSAGPQTAAYARAYEECNRQLIEAIERIIEARGGRLMGDRG